MRNANLTATAIDAAGTGNVLLDTTTSGDITIDLVEAEDDDVTINSAGAIDDDLAGDGTDILADVVDLDAATGIGATVEIDLSETDTLTADTTTGDIDINNAANAEVTITSLTTADGDIAPGPIFVMEKMAAGFNYVSGDWRYSVIGPEGEVWGTTNGAGAERVEFCIGCHLAREKYDHLYFVPKKFRVGP